MNQMRIIGLFLFVVFFSASSAFAGLLDQNMGSFGDGGPCGIVNCGVDGNMNSGPDVTIAFSDGSIFVRKNQQGKLYDKNGITDCVYNYRRCEKKLVKKTVSGVPPDPKKGGKKGKKTKKKAKDKKNGQSAATSSAATFSGKRARPPHVNLRKGDARAAHLRKKQ